MPTMQDAYKEGKENGMKMFLDLCENFRILYSGAALFNCCIIVLHTLMQDFDEEERQKAVGFIVKRLLFIPEIATVSCSICKKDMSVLGKDKDLVQVCIPCLKKNDKEE